LQKEILINVDRDETRVAVVEDGQLVELYYERPVSQRTVGNVYKGKVENVLPGMQAAFVDIGLDRNAFLYVDDAIAAAEDDDLPAPSRLTIKDLLHSGQDVLLQVVKEPMGTKGARVTSNLTLPGRNLVLMPTVEYVGVSRRISSDGERDRLRKLAHSLKPKGMGVIVRTVAEGKDEAEIKSDMDFLVKVWQKIQSRGKTAQAPALIHKDLGLIFRIVRDLFSEDVDRLVVDSRHEYDRILDLLEDAPGSLKSRVHLFETPDRSVFDIYGLESEIDKATKKRVWLKSGGYIIIDQTEALTVIDVNTGKFVGSTNLADTVLKTNLEAAKEIPRQLRLRDIGGIIIIDFIDMEVAEHRHELIRALNENLRKDRTRTNVLGLTQLGLVEMTRKKVKQGLDEVLMETCPYCDGRGRVLSPVTMAGRVRRELRQTLAHSDAEAVLAEVQPSVAALLIGSGGVGLRDLEKQTGKSIYVKGAEDLHMEKVDIRCLGTREEVERLALPVRPGDVLDITVEEQHVTNVFDGISRIEGYVIDIAGGSKYIGEKVRIEITKAFRTYAKAKIV
jgi:ribonuclease G